MPMAPNYGMRGDEMDQVATHQRLLVAACMRTTGDILELGVGWYSTPLLHEIAVAQKRHLHTMDNNEQWLVQFMALEHEYHRLTSVGWWGDAWRYIKRKYSVVFVDQGQPCEREYAIRHLLRCCEVDLFVMHDTEEGFAYGYDRTLPMFRYTYTDVCQKAHTTIASNTLDVTEWFLDLPPVEQTEEVT